MTLKKDPKALLARVCESNVSPSGPFAPFFCVEEIALQAKWPDTFLPQLNTTPAALH